MRKSNNFIDRANAVLAISLAISSSYNATTHRQTEIETDLQVGVLIPGENPTQSFLFIDGEIYSPVDPNHHLFLGVAEATPNGAAVIYTESGLVIRIGTGAGQPPCDVEVTIRENGTFSVVNSGNSGNTCQ